MTGSSGTKGRVVVVGAGVIGLTSAIRLIELGWSVRIVTAELSEETTLEHTTSEPKIDMTPPTQPTTLVIALRSLPTPPTKPGGVSPDSDLDHQLRTIL